MENAPEKLELQTTPSLLEEVRQGSDEALEVLCRRYRGPLRRFARSRLPAYARDLKETDDLVLEMLEGTLRELPRLEPQGSGALLGYLREEVLSSVREKIRRVSRRPPATESTSRPEAHEASPVEQLTASETLDGYEKALARLKPADREAVIARLEFGLSYGETARHLGETTPDAARIAVGRALIRLASEIARPDGAQRSHA